MAQASRTEPTDLTDQEWSDAFSVSAVVQSSGDLILDTLDVDDYSVGDSAFGGIVADVGVDSLLIVQSAHLSNSVYGCYGTAISGAGSSTNGEQNTEDIAAAPCYSATSAAGRCYTSVVNGYTDWFLPATGQLATMYTNRAAIGGFSSTWYWSSREASSTDAYLYSFEGYGLANTSKLNSRKVRATRTQGAITAGSRISNPLSLSEITSASASNIEWESTEASGTDIKVYTAITESDSEEPVSWNEETSGSSITDATGDLSSKYLWVKQELTTDDAETSPILDTITFSISGATIISVDDTLTISDDTSIIRERILSLSDTLNLTDDESLEKAVSIVVSDTLLLSDIESILRERLLSVDDTISLSDDIEAIKILITSVSDTISMSDAETIARVLLVDFPIMISDANAGFKPTLNDDKFNPKISGDTQVFKPRINNN